MTKTETAAKMAALAVKTGEQLAALQASLAAPAAPECELALEHEALVAAMSTPGRYRVTINRPRVLRFTALLRQLAAQAGCRLRVQGADTELTTLLWLDVEEA